MRDIELVSQEQIDLMNSLADSLYIININNLLNYENLYIRMLEIKDSSYTNRMKWRYSERFNGLGKDIIDCLNIVI